MPDLRSNNLYAQIGIRDFATSTEIAEKLSQIDDIESDELKTAAEILADYSLKNAYDMILEALANSDRLLPRFASPDAATVVIDVANRVGFNLKEVHTNTYQIISTTTPDSSGRHERDDENTDLRIKVGNQELMLEAARFIAHRDRFSKKIVLETDTAESRSLVFIPDTIVQDDTKQGDEGILIRLKQIEGLAEPISFAILNQSQRLTAPLAAGGRYLFSKSRQTIANSYQIRDSNERVKQLIRSYYRDLAELISHLDSRIGQKVTVRSYIKYFERYHNK